MKPRALQSCIFLALSASATEAPAPLAWLSIDKGIEAAQEYDGVPYIWLGRADIHLTIDVPPKPGHVLELAWGAKNDTREALITINGQQLKLSAGGYAGFKPLLVSVPDKVAGQRYDIALTRLGERAAFISAVRLLSKEKPDEEGVDPKKPAHKIALKLDVKALPTSPPQGEAFPEMRKVWDTPHPAPRHAACRRQAGGRVPRG